jgi:hypothetical protein
MLNNDTTKTVVNAVRYAVKSRKAWEAFVAENGVTRGTIKDYAREVALLAYPVKDGEKPVQTVDGVRTPYGNAVQAAGYMMRAVLATDSEDSTTPDVALITRAGAKATKEEIIKAWEAAQK